MGGQERPNAGVPTILCGMSETGEDTSAVSGVPSVDGGVLGAGGQPVEQEHGQEPGQEQASDQQVVSDLVLSGDIEPAADDHPLVEQGWPAEAVGQYEALEAAYPGVADPAVAEAVLDTAAALADELELPPGAENDPRVLELALREMGATPLAPAEQQRQAQQTQNEQTADQIVAQRSGSAVLPFGGGPPQQRKQSSADPRADEIVAAGHVGARALPFG